MAYAHGKILQDRDVVKNTDRESFWHLINISMTFQNYVLLATVSIWCYKNWKKHPSVRAYNTYTVWRWTKDFSRPWRRIGAVVPFSYHCMCILSFQLFSFFFWKSCKIVQWFNLTKVVLCCWEVKVLDTRLAVLFSLSNDFKGYRGICKCQKPEYLDTKFLVFLHSWQHSRAIIWRDWAL